jgi:heme exporter protein C
MATETSLSTSASSVSAERGRAGTMPAALAWLLFLWMSAVIYAAFFIVPPAKGLGATTAVLYFHVPMAWNGGFGLILSGVYSGLYLWKRRMGDDTKAVAAAELGLLFCILATLTGALWARSQWGAWWNWDPKQTSILALILIYGAYFALRSSVEFRPLRAKLGAAYALLSVVTVPLLMRIIPYYLKGLHPNPVAERTMDPRMGLLLAVSSVGFLGLYLWIFRQRVAVGMAEDRMEEAE